MPQLERTGSMERTKSLKLPKYLNKIIKQSKKEMKKMPGYKLATVYLGDDPVLKN